MPRAGGPANSQRFELKRRLGVGGMGTVYEAYDRDKDATVALKVLKHADSDGLARFKREFRAVQALNHPNLVRLDELVEGEDQWFFTMELVRGTDFLSYVRGDSDLGRPFDEARLRDALRQLALGLHAFHTSGGIHRDVKPPNILVTDEGRVVLLDFGLTTRAEPERQSTELHPVGTAAYMAPEQASARPLGAAADWYSVGTILFEALTAGLPFEGSTLQVMMDKQEVEPQPPRALEAEIPPDLDALCTDLLRTNPRARPDGPEVLRRLGVPESEIGGAAGSSVSFDATPPFVGREPELAALEQALARSRHGPTVFVVRGESGLGKTELATHFAEQQTRRAANLVLLSGRCYERETVSYKAFDGVAESLRRHLRTLPGPSATALLPEDATLLPELFPTLQRVQAITRARRRGDIRDPQERRRAMFEALCQLLAAIAETAPLMMLIDDLQWTDVDSLALLQYLLAHTHAPNMLVVVTMRPVADESRQASLRPLLELPVTELLDLAPLADDTARTLAARLLPKKRHGTVDGIVREAGGHPMFLQELARASQLGTAREQLSLETTLFARVCQLGSHARHVLELVSVAGSPFRQDLVAEAAELDYETHVSAVSTLRVASLVRTEGLRKSDTIEVFHDRVREVVLANLDDDTKRGHHARLAASLESLGGSEVNPQVLVRHALSAGDEDRAARYAALAAEQAARAMAFDRAAGLFRIALRHGDADTEATRGLQIALAEALANSGRGAEAAEVYLRAAQGATAAQSLDLRRRAAEEQLQNGLFDEGLHTLEDVLAEVDQRLASSPKRALASLLWQRFRLRLRGLRTRARDASEVSAAELTRLDVLWTVAHGLSLTDNIRGAEYQARYFRACLDVGERSHVTRGLGMEIAFSGAGGSKTSRRTDRLEALAAEWVDEADDPVSEGFVEVASGIAELLRGNWAASLEHASKGSALLRTQHGVAWELRTSRMFELAAQCLVGQWRQLAERVPELVRAADQRGNLHQAVTLRTWLTNTAWLVLDQPERAQREITAAERMWTPEGFHLQHHYALLGQVRVDMYMGRGREALERIERDWAPLGKSLLRQIQLIDIEAYQMRAQAAATILAAGDDGPALRKRAASDIQRIERTGLAYCLGFGGLLRAALASSAGDAPTSIRILEQLEALLTTAHMHGHAAAAAYRRGQLIGGAEGETAVASASTALGELGARNPAGMVNMLAPGFVI